MTDVSERGRICLWALVDGPASWRSAPDLGDATGLGPDLLAELADLDAGGWLEIADGDDGPLVMLSALGAERLGVRLFEQAEDSYRWVPLSDPWPPERQARESPRHVAPTDIEGLVDPAPGPAELARRSEQSGRWGEDVPDGEPPRPSILIGLALSPWPTSPPDPDRPCPGCRGRHLPPSWCCLVCLRWGLDHTLFAGGDAGRRRREAITRRVDRNRRKARTRRTVPRTTEITPAC